MDENPIIENIYLDAGGIYGFCLCGALQILKKKNLLKNIKNILGCSVGGFIGLLFALDYTTEEIYNIGVTLDLSKIISMKSNQLFNIINNYGFDSGNKLSQIIKLLIMKKTGNENLTFQQLYDFNSKSLIIIGSNVSTKKHDVFSIETNPTMEIWKAIRITCGFPLVFQPFIYNNHFYIDGGNSNYLTNYFSDQSRTIGIILEDSNFGETKIDSFESYITNILMFPLKSNKYSCYYKDNCLEIDTNKLILGCMDLTIPNKSKFELFKLGVKEVEEKLPQLLNNLKKIKNI